MTPTHDELLAPVAVARTEDRARGAWLLCGAVGATLIALVGLAYGFTWPAVLEAVWLVVLVASGWAWLRTAGTLRAAGDRAREASRGRRSSTRRWSRAVRDGRLADVEPEEAPLMVRWAEAATVRARLVPYGLGGLWLALAALQLVALSLGPTPVADGPVTRSLGVLVLGGLFGTAWAVHRRHRLRLETFLDGHERARRRP